MPEITNKSEEQKVAEAEVESVRKDLGPFVVAAETTRMAMVFTDAKEQGHPIIFANDAFLSLTGASEFIVLLLMILSIRRGSSSRWASQRIP